MRVANHDAEKRFFTEFPTQLVWHFGENNAPEDAELGCVRHRRRKERERNAGSQADRADVRAIAEVHNGADSARPHGIGDGHDVEHSRRIVPDSAPWAFSFAEHVMGMGSKELHPNAEVGAHMAGDNNFKHKVRVEFCDLCERAGSDVMECMQVLNSEHASSLHLRNLTHM
jgi:hypothetical protein